MRARQIKRRRVSRAGRLIHIDAARIGKAEGAGRLVIGFADRIVMGPPNHMKFSVILHLNNMAVPA